MTAPPPTVGSMQTGTVKTWMEERGMGFIAPDVGGDDLFIHRSDLQDGNCLVVGSPVHFEDSWDPAKGKRVAKQVTGALTTEGKGAGSLGAPGAGKGPVASSGQMPVSVGAMLEGTVKSWYDEKGMGFIAPDTGGDDCFCHRSYLADGQYLVVGSRVAFQDGWDERKSKRTASNVTGAQGGQPGMQGGGMGSMGGGMMGMQGMNPNMGMGGMGGMGFGGCPGQPPPPNVPPPVGLQPIPSTAGMTSGTVKAWIEARGMGFIQPDNGMDDVFVHRSCLTDCQFLTVGSPVMYEESWDAAKGKMMAKTVVTTGFGGPAAGMQAGYGMGGQPGMGMQMGTVKSWLDDRGMGFIKPNSGGDDCFVHRSDLLDGQWLVVGQQVSFEESFDPSKGKSIAKRVSGASSAMGKGGGVPSGGMQTGTIKMWFNDKAFGFIVPDAGGDDVMVHKNEVAEGLQLEQGTPVRFEANWDPVKNKLKATRCIGIHGDPSMYQMSAPGGKGGAPTQQGDNLFIAGLPVDINEENIKMIFGQYGAVSSCKVLPNNGKPDAAALVRMGDPAMATWLVDNINGNIPVGLSTPISVRYAQSGGGKGGAGGGYGKASGGGHDYRSSPYGEMGAPMGGAPGMAFNAAPPPMAAPPMAMGGGGMVDEGAALAALLAGQMATMPV